MMSDQKHETFRKPSKGSQTEPPSEGEGKNSPESPSSVSAEQTGPSEPHREGPRGDGPDAPSRPQPIPAEGNGGIESINVENEGDEDEGANIESVGELTLEEQVKRSSDAFNEIHGGYIQALERHKIELANLWSRLTGTPLSQMNVVVGADGRAVRFFIIPSNHSLVPNQPNAEQMAVMQRQQMQQGRGGPAKNIQKRV